MKTFLNVSIFAIVLAFTTPTVSIAHKSYTDYYKNFTLEKHSDRPISFRGIFIKPSQGQLKISGLLVATFSARKFESLDDVALTIISPEGKVLHRQKIEPHRQPSATRRAKAKAHFATTLSFIPPTGSVIRLQYPLK